MKSDPKVDLKFLRKVQEYNPDKIFIVDVPLLEQEFVDEVKRPVIWIDHHPVLDIKGIKYYNPLMYGEEHPPVTIYVIKL